MSTLFDRHKREKEKKIKEKRNADAFGWCGKRSSKNILSTVLSSWKWAQKTEDMKMSLFCVCYHWVINKSDHPRVQWWDTFNVHVTHATAETLSYLLYLRRWKWKCHESCCRLKLRWTGFFWTSTEWRNADKESHAHFVCDQAITQCNYFPHEYFDWWK